MKASNSFYVRLASSAKFCTGFIAASALALFSLAFTDLASHNAALADNPIDLTKSLAGKYDARVVMIYDHECAVWCGQVRPIMSDLRNEYKSKVQFVELDTSKEQLANSKTTAKTIGVSKFLNENADYAPVIGVFSAKGKLLKELVGPKKKEIYTDAISKALAP
ncbi:hypothetical protein BH11CYA1_BH11CYA1_43280 [soil metagenome]